LFRAKEKKEREGGEGRFLTISNQKGGKIAWMFLPEEGRKKKRLQREGGGEGGKGKELEG